MSDLNVKIGMSQITIPKESGAYTKDLLVRFCRCETAKNFLTSLASKTKIFLQVGNFERANADWAPLTSQHEVIISIPKEPRSPGIDSEVSALAFELFNAQNLKKFETNEDLAARGELGMEEYVKQKETVEASAGMGRLNLQKNCADKWNIVLPQSNPNSIDAKITTIESSLWKSEWQCHTDAYRQNWIEDYKQAYCKTHPEDKKSCTAKTSQLCYEKYNNLNRYEKGPFLADRLCKGFFKTAPKNLKPALIPIVKSTCPHILEKTEI